MRTTLRVGKVATHGVSHGLLESVHVLGLREYGLAECARRQAAIRIFFNKEHDF